MNADLKWISIRVRLRPFCFLGAAAAVLLAAQQAPEPGEIRANTASYRPRTAYQISADARLVEIGVVVRDPQGHTVDDLTKDDFEISDEGKRRTVTAFSVERSVALSAAPSSAAGGEAPPGAVAAPAKISPRYVALLFDDISMGPQELPRAQAAAHRFVKEDLRAGDHVAIYSISGEQDLPFTPDANVLAGAIDHLHLNGRVPQGGYCPHISPYEAYVIANGLDLDTYSVKVAETYRCENKPVPTGRASGGSPLDPRTSEAKAVVEQARQIWEQVRQTSETTVEVIQDLVDRMARLTGGDRLVLLASSGFYSGTLEQEMDELISRAVHGGVVIDALDAKGLFTTEPIQVTGGMDARSITRQQLIGTLPKDLANDSMAALAYSTGGLFFHNNNDLDAGFRQLGMRPGVSYLLGFTPEGKPDGKYHKLKIRLTQPGHNTVQARLGYMAVDRPAAAPRRIDTVATEEDALNELAGSLTSQIAPSDSGQPTVMAVFHIDVRQLPFDDDWGVRRQRLSLIAVLTDSQGSFVAGKESTVVLALGQATYDRILPDGVNLTLQLEAPPGSYKLREVMSDGAESKVSALTLPVEVR